MTDTRQNNNLIKLAVIVFIASFLLWQPLYDWFAFKTYYCGTALTIFIMALLIFIYNKGFFAFILLTLSLNNFLDELFFDPTKLQINELLILPISIALWMIYKKFITKL